MAKHTSTCNLLSKGFESPKRFWPNPDEEMFYKARTPPWEVPTRRKTRGSKVKFLYDLTGKNIMYMNSGEVTTSNKFELLDLEEDTSSSTDHESTSPSRKKREELSLKSSEGELFDTGFLNNSENTLYSTYDDFMSTRSNLVDDNINYMYTNKYNFCSGYFPEFITLDNNNAYN